MAAQQPAPVVVGFDGSPGARTALWAAAWEARSRRVPLRVVHGFEQPLTTFGPDVLAQYGIETVARGTRQMLDEAAADVSHRYPGVEVTTAVVTGRAVEVLVEESRDAALTVLGSRGRAAVVDVLAGTVSIQVATHGRGPVVVIPPQDGCGGQTPFTTNARMVVGVDGSDGSTQATAFAVEEAVARGGGLTAVYAWTAPDTQATRRDTRRLDPAGLRERAQQILTDTMRRWMTAYPGLTVECRVVPGKDTAQVLMDAGTDAAVLVVGSRGRGGFAGLLLGSVGATLLRRSHRPVAIVPARTTSAG